MHLGRDLAPNFPPTVIFNAFGDSFSFSPDRAARQRALCSTAPAGSSQTPDTGWSNQVRTTPNFGGFHGKPGVQFGEVAGTIAATATSAPTSCTSAGPFALAVSVHNVRTNNPERRYGWAGQRWAEGPMPRVGPVNPLRQHPRIQRQLRRRWQRQRTRPEPERRSWLLAPARSGRLCRHQVDDDAHQRPQRQQARHLLAGLRLQLLQAHRRLRGLHERQDHQL